MKFITKSILIILGFILTSGIAQAEFIAKNGILDLRFKEMPKKEGEAVRGNWRFFWNKAIPINSKDHNLTGGINIPWTKPWYGVEYLSKELPGQGFASYYLKIIPPDKTYPLAITFPNPRRSFQIWINGVFHGQSGETSFEEIKSRKPDKAMVIKLPENANEYHLVIHSSNHISLLGTSPQPMLIGSYSNLYSKQLTSMVLNLIAAGASLIFALKYFALFITRRRYQSYLWISLYSLAIFVNQSAFSLSFSPELTSLGQQEITKILLFSLFCLYPFYVLLAHSLYPETHPNWLVKLVIIPQSITLLVIVFGPLNYAEFTLLIVMPYVLIFVPLLILAAWRTFKAQGKWSILLLIAILLMFSSTLRDMVWNYGLLVDHQPFIFNFAIPLFMLVILFDQYDIDAFEEVKRLSNSLQQQVTEKTKSLSKKVSILQAKEQELAIAYSDLEELHQSKSRFLTAASHDLRQPLHAMSLQVGLLRESTHDPENEDLINRISMAQDSIEETLNALLDISRLDSGLIEAQITHFNVSDLFVRLKAEFQLQAERRNIQLKIRPSRHWAHSDPALLYRILSNLTDNALKHSNASKILISSRATAKGISIDIRDNGKGIADEKKQDIFNEFVQLDNPSRDQSKGLGIGLSVVKRLSLLLDAPINLESQEDTGSCFNIIVKPGMPTSDKKIIDRENLPPTYDLTGAVVLIVDDDPRVCQATKSLLKSWSCACIVASDLNSAMEEAEDEDIDIIIADFRLGDGNTGPDVISSINKAMGITHKAVIITGEANPDAIKSNYKIDYPILSKPVSPITLRSTLHRLFLEK